MVHLYRLLDSCFTVKKDSKRENIKKRENINKKKRDYIIIGGENKHESLEFRCQILSCIQHESLINQHLLTCTMGIMKFEIL